MTTSGIQESPLQATRREWIGLAILALPTLLLSLDVSVLYLALPHLTADLKPSSTQLLWITDIYGFMIAGFLITMGTLGDRIGRRKLLMIGAAAFGTASVVAAYSASAEMLIATRALLGIAGATLMPSTLALISNMFKDPRQRGIAIAVWMSSFMGGMAFGPVVGGLLLESFWWGSVFLMGVPVMALLLGAAPVLLPEYRDTNAGRLDLTSVALSLGAILPVIYGLKETAKDGIGTTPVLAMIAGFAIGALFTRRQRTLSSPLLDVRLFRNPAFSTSLAIFLLTGVTMGGVFLFISQYLQLVEGLSPLRAGLWLVPSSLATIAGSMMAPVLVRWMRPGVVIASGLGLGAVGLLVVTRVDSTSSLGLVVIGNVLMSLGMGPTVALITDLIVGSAPPEKAGSASAMSETSGELGFALGVAIMGSIGTAVYRSRIADSLPSGIPESAAATSRDTLAGALTASESLPAELALALTDASQAAFTRGLNTVASVGVGVVALLAALALFLLRDAPPKGQEETATDQERAIDPATRPAPTAA